MIKNLRSSPENLYQVLMFDTRLHRKSNELPVGNKLKQNNELDTIIDTIHYNRYHFPLAYPVFDCASCPGRGGGDLNIALEG